MARTSLVPQQPVFLSEADNKQLAEMDRQREAFNAAVEKYNQGMMGPGGYNEQLNAYIARLKEIEASGEEVPLPTAPTKMDVPVAPFTEESFVQAQEAAQARAQEAAGQRALAIQAFEDPSRFNLAGFAGLGSRTFAKGGEVKEEGTKASRMMKELGLSKPPKEKTLADEPSKQTPESLAYSLRAQAEGNRDKDLRRGSFSVPGALNVKRFEAGGEARSGEGFSPVAGSMGMPGAPEHERMRADTLGFIKRMDDASVMATASRMTGMPFDTPTQARLMLEQLLGGGVSVSAGVMGIGEGMPERVVGYDVGAKFPALGGQMSVGAMVPRGAGKPSFNVGYRKEFKDGGDVSSEASESRSYLDELEARDDPIRSGRPLSRKGRAKGTQESNEAMSQAVLQGMANMPYNIAGIPGDLANLLAAPTGSQPFYGSESAKALATQLGIRPAPPTDPAAAALYGAADIGSSLINPAGPVRAAARGAERAGTALSGAAKDFQEYNRMLDVPGASYAVRPEGSQLVIRRDNSPDWVGQLLDDGLRDARYVTPIGAAPERVALMENFWNNKAANYFAKQFGTESDPIYRGIRDQYIKSPRLAKDFPDYVLDQLSVGKTRVDAATGQSRFFPKYPAAYDAMRAKYDELTQIRGAVPARDPSQVMSSDYTYSPSRQGAELLDELKNREIDRMIEQGTPVSQADPSLEFLTRSVKTPDTILGPYNAKSILQDYEKATGTRLGDPNFQGVPEPEALPQNLRTAFDKGEIMYGTSGPNAPLRQLFDTNSINEFLKTLSDRELKNVRFEDAVKGGAKVSAKRQERETLAADIRAGKRVPDRIFSEGVSAPLLQFNEGPLAGFAWKRIEKAEATVPEGAYLGHSVGGYAEGGAYGPGKHRDFNEGRSQVYTLRDNRNRPVTTVEVSMRDIGPIVTQIKGNGRATGNAAPVKYDEAVLQFFKDYLKPVRIAESEDYLTPLLKQYKQQFVANMKDGGEVTSNDAFIAKHQAGGEAKSKEPQVTGISRLVDFIAQRLSPESFPTAARTLLESAQGKKDPITEASFSKDELEVLRRLTKTDKGRVNYEDYSRLAEQLRQEGQSGADATPSLFSLGSPVGNVRNTLGRFTYTRDPQGNVVVVDKYDFNPPVSGQTQESRTSDYGVFGPYNVIREYAGQKLPPGKGRDVRINLVNPVPQANGSTRNN